MSVREHQHDILGELFRGEQGLAAVSGLEELESLIHVCLAPKSPAQRPKMPKLPLKRKQGGSRKKSTHYLRTEVFDGLTQAKEILMRLLPNGSKTKASKSNLVNCAVREMLREIEEKGADSPMVKAILKGQK